MQAFDIVFATKADLVGPIDIAAVPVDAAARNCDRLAASFPDFLAIAVLRDFGRQRSRQRLSLGEPPPVRRWNRDTAVNRASRTSRALSLAPVTRAPLDAADLCRNIESPARCCRPAAV